MTALALSEQQSQTISFVLKRLFEECEADAVAVCELGGNILAQETRDPGKSIGNAAALAAATFAAARALAESIGESAFRSIYHKGRKSGIMIQALGDEYLVLVVLGEKSVEGIVRLYLRKVVQQLVSILSKTSDHVLADAGLAGSFEVKEDSGSSDRTV
jgi:predicted regulator of Ras-like GTPase activity (Roadblock/LC7/MglB family)